VTRFGRPALFTLLVLGAAVLVGCAKPGQLGYRAPEPAPVAAAPAAPGAEPAAPPTGSALIATGTVRDPVQLRTSGPTEFTIRTVVLAPGESTGWHRHPGAETTVVNSGTITVQRAENCTPERYDAGQAVFVADAEPHIMRNDGVEPAQLVVTRLLAPGEPDRAGADAAC
jgi:quercetin dioxygenase-like cupin family protein